MSLEETVKPVEKVQTQSLTGHMFLDDSALKNKHDPVEFPSHYDLCGVEAADIIKMVLNSDLCADMDRWQAACFKDVLKYRLRAGKKGNALQDIDKAIKYEAMFRND